VTSESNELLTLPSNRLLFISSGIISIIIGIVLLAWPEATVTVLAILLGIDLILLGVAILIGSFAAATSTGGTILGSLLGVLAILAGVAVFGRPLQTAAALVVIVGMFWVVGGIIEVVTGLFGGVVGSRLLAVLSGAVSIVFGLVLLSWPGPTLAVLIWLIGIWSLLSGIIWFFRGLRTPRVA
jgi:uncharacterized membrane protein HdeD (DUF308 family)